MAFSPTFLTGPLTGIYEPIGTGAMFVAVHAVHAVHAVAGHGGRLGAV
ncbi:hypothetical protein [Streptomyces sp. H27-C3]|nr:hypothetical protein [Streptomyces sp. H27-C3]MDJ0460128.1 hypothetical protein [Streptomyces sp. H27-C3]